MTAETLARGIAAGWGQSRPLQARAGTRYPSVRGAHGAPRARLAKSRPYSVRVRSWSESPPGLQGHAATGTDQARHRSARLATWLRDYPHWQGLVTARLAEVEHPASARAVAPWLDVRGTHRRPPDPLWWAELLGVVRRLEPRPLCPPYAPAGTLRGEWRQLYQRPQGGAVVFQHASAGYARPHNYLVHCFHREILNCTREVVDIAFAHPGPLPAPSSLPRPWHERVHFGHGCGVDLRRGRVVEPWPDGKARWPDLGITGNTEARRRARWGDIRLIYAWPSEHGVDAGGGGGVAPWEDALDPIIVPRRHWYMILHDIEAVRLPDRTPLPWVGLSLATDASQWGWSMSLDLVGANAASLIQPSGDDPVRIEIGINGATWVVLAEDWSDTEDHGQRRLNVRGRSLTALLSDRYVRPRDYTEGSLRTMAQLAEQELPGGGPWSLTWEPADWSVPAGAWGYQSLSPIQAIARLAEAAGGLVAASPNAESLTVRPVYPLLPWVWASGQEDLLIPASAILHLERRYRAPDQANAVHLYGGEVAGLQATIYRTGSAGDEYLPDRSEPLLVHTDGAIALGSRLLAGAARPASVAGLTMPVDPTGDFPLANLGDLVRVDVDGGQMGPVTAITISVRGGRDVTVRQTLGIGERPNQYHRLLAMMPREPRRLGQIATNHGDGTVTVDLATGGTSRVRGTGSVNDWVWIRSGRVEDQAPSLPGYTIEI